MIVKGLILPGGYAEPARGRDRICGDSPLQPVANRPILGHVLQELRRAAISEVVLAVPPGAQTALQTCVEAECPRGLAVQYVHCGRDGCLEQTLADAAPLIGDSACVVHSADGLLAQPLAPLAELLREHTPDLVVLLHNSRAAAGSIGLTTRRLLRLAGVREDGAADLSEVWLLGPGALRHMGKADGDGQPLDLVAIGERLARAGGALRVERVRGWHRAGGTTAELLELNRVALDALHWTDAPLTSSERAVDGSRIEGSVAVDPTACVQSSVIVGPAIVGAGALVLDAYIGPYTSIGAGARVEGAEVEQSIVLQDASITHIGGRLVGSLVGREARIFRDFSLPRALRVTVGDGNEVALC